MDVVAVNTSFVNGVTTATVNPSTGVTINSVTVTSSTNARINISIAAGTAAASRDITLKTNTEYATGEGLFVIGAPSFTITPNSGDQGAVLTGVAIVGTGTHFINGTTFVMFPVGGFVSATNVVVSDATHLTCDIVIGASAATGAKDIQVITASIPETVTGTGAFTVNTPDDDRFFYEKAGGIMMAYPNPFDPNDKANPLTMLFNTATGEAVDIYIFDTNARIIYQSRDNQLAADRIVTWDGDTSYGEVVENGLYLIRVVNGGKLVAKGKILVIKK
jgi:hypothetical protein